MARTQVSAVVDKDAKCDICDKPLRSGRAFYDAATVAGPWAWMCMGCFCRYGRGLGQGVGQEYDSRNDLKIRG